MAHFLLLTLIVTAVLSAVILIYYREELRIHIWTSAVLSVLHTAAGVICVKLFAGLESLSNPLHAGMSLFGAIFFLPLLYWVCSRLTHRDTAVVFDDFCLCVIIAMMCVRFNCIVSGCCAGRFIAETNVRWPTRQAEILFWAALLLWFLHKKRQGYIKGILYPQMMMLYGIFRFFIEFLRDEKAVIGGFHFGHIWAVVSFFVGSFVYFALIERSKS